MFTSIITRKFSNYFPRLGLSSLILCLASGVVLAFYYRPFGNVFQNVEELTTLAPYGAFFRQFHYASGQVFVVLMLLHAADHFLRRRYEVYRAREWSYLIVSLCLCFFTLFTGFILKGDKEGVFAGRIFFNILETLPVLGSHASRLFIEPGGGFFFLPYLYHGFFLPALIIYLLRGHIREWLPDMMFLYLTFLGLFFYALLIDPHQDIPPDMPVAVVKGPWFFLGLQTLLKHMDPLLAGIAIPAGFTACLLILPVASVTWSRRLYWLISGAFFFYAVITFRALIWGP